MLEDGFEGVLDPLGEVVDVGREAVTYIVVEGCEFSFKVAQAGAGSGAEG